MGVFLTKSQFGATLMNSMIIILNKLKVLKMNLSPFIFGPDIVIEAEEKVKQIRANILTIQSCQKSYTDKRRRPLEFEVGDH
jgi:hypothetical protein